MPVKNPFYMEKISNFKQKNEINYKILIILKDEPDCFGNID